MFAPASRLRAAVTPSGRGRGRPRREADAKPGSEPRRGMTWAQRLKRVFAIDIETCRRCGGRLKVIASIEQPEFIARILAHLARPLEADPHEPFAARAPPPQPPLL